MRPVTSVSQTEPAFAVSDVVADGGGVVEPGVPTVLGALPPPQPAANIAKNNGKASAPSVFSLVWIVRSCVDIGFAPNRIHIHYR